MLYETHVGDNCKICGSPVILIPCKLGLTWLFWFFLWDCCVVHNAFSTVIEVGIFFASLLCSIRLDFKSFTRCAMVQVGVCLYEHARLLCKLYIFFVPQLQRTIWWSTVLQLLNVKGRPEDEPDVCICSCLLWNITEIEFLYLVFLCDPDVL